MLRERLELRLADEDKVALRRIAKTRGMNASQFVRFVIRQDETHPLNVTKTP